jgi:hypothetical protein
MTRTRKVKHQEVSTAPNRNVAKKAYSEVIPERVAVVRKLQDRTDNLRRKTQVYDAVQDKKKLKDWNRAKDDLLLKIMRTRAEKAGSVSAVITAHEKDISLLTTDEETSHAVRSCEVALGQIYNVLREQLHRFPANAQHPDHPRHCKNSKRIITLSSLYNDASMDIFTNGKQEIVHLACVCAVLKRLDHNVLKELYKSMITPYFVVKDLDKPTESQLRTTVSCVLVTASKTSLNHALNTIEDEELRAVLNEEVQKWHTNHEMQELERVMQLEF